MSLFKIRVSKYQLQIQDRYSRQSSGQSVNEIRKLAYEKAIRHNEVTITDVSNTTPNNYY